MKLLIALILFLHVFYVMSNCPTSKKISCAAAMVGCGITCTCDIPVCECCPACIACVTATVANCCECLFPNWSGCTDKKLMTEINQYSKLFVNKTIGSCECYMGQGPDPCGTITYGQICCNSRWCPCNPNTSPCNCGTALC